MIKQATSKYNVLLPARDDQIDDQIKLSIAFKFTIIFSKWYLSLITDYFI